MVAHAEVRQFVADILVNKNRDVAKAIVDRFGFSRQAASSHLQLMVEHGEIAPSGSTRNREYSLVQNVLLTAAFPLGRSFEERRIWSEHCEPAFGPMPDKAQRILNYGMTEMLNNANDHSGASEVTVQLAEDVASYHAMVSARGVGIFKKIKDSCGLSSEADAIFELSKGKLTTVSSMYSGEGIYYTSRACDVFALTSGNHALFRESPVDSIEALADHTWGDWRIEHPEPLVGTIVRMTVRKNARRSLLEVFVCFMSWNRCVGTDGSWQRRFGVPILRTAGSATAIH